MGYVEKSFSCARHTTIAFQTAFVHVAVPTSQFHIILPKIMTAVEKDTLCGNFHKQFCCNAALAHAAIAGDQKYVQILKGVSHINRIFYVSGRVYCIHRTVNWWN